MATAESIKSRARFAAACGVLSRHVKAAEKAAAVMEAVARPAATVVALPLMPGADVSPAQEEHEPAQAQAAPQLTIFYGGRMVVLDDVPADKAAQVFRLAAAAKEAPGHAVLPAASSVLPVERKASLQRFMEKRRSRVAARAAPYSRPDGGVCDDACPDSLALSL
ncbi:hypothetical protein EJB05_22578, partial [Eragrostis curvula]